MILYTKCCFATHFVDYINVNYIKHKISSAQNTLFLCWYFPCHFPVISMSFCPFRWLSNDKYIANVYFSKFIIFISIFGGKQCFIESSSMICVKYMSKIATFWVGVATLSLIAIPKQSEYTINSKEMTHVISVYPCLDSVQWIHIHFICDLFLFHVESVQGWKRGKPNFIFLLSRVINALIV